MVQLRQIHFRFIAIKRMQLVGCFCCLLLTFGSAVGQQTASPLSSSKTWFADEAAYGRRDFGWMKDSSLPGHRAVYCKNQDARKGSYLLLKINLPAAAIYEFSSYALPVPGKAQMPVNGYRMQCQWNGDRLTSRIVYDNYKGGYQYIGRFDLPAGENRLKIWLPAGIALGYISCKAYEAPALPEKMVNYKPAVLPPPQHPRLWVTPSFLPVLRERMSAPENQAAWQKVQQRAVKILDYNPDSTQESFYNADLEELIREKAFYYLVEGDSTVGKEAVDLMRKYFSVLEFGNVTYGDITREIGRSIYTGSLVYDWCYNMMDPSQRSYLRLHMLRLARDMEIGWPPFVDPIVNGHANEAQVSRDLLAMSIAVYNEDTIPYRYTSYALLKQLVPMRQFEYQSPRHNQGVDYGAYRFGWEMHGAMLFYRMLGQKLYPDNLKNLPYYWIYMRLPNGYMLRDGDMFSNKNAKNREIYWKQPQTMLLCYSYLEDPVLKGEFEREGGLPDDPVLYLLLNDPALKPVMQPSHLPLTKDFGKILGGMLARSGWNNTPESDDVVAEIRGGGYLFGNHQHSDAGAIQLYYHGMQLGDIGLYLSYGSPYDYNFNKRSVAHSMMLAYDPKEKLFYRAKTNDGGTRFSQRFPVSPEQTINDPWFNGGAVLSSYAGPDPVHPLFSYFKAELSPAYSAKMSSYTRSFCFLHLNNPKVPAVIILADDMETASEDIKQYWQVNAFNRPDIAGSKIMLHSSEAGITGYTAVNMLLPKQADRDMSILGGDSSRNVFGTYYAVDTSWPESRAYRIMISPKEKSRKQRYLTVFQMTRDSTQLLPVQFTDHAHWYELIIDKFIQVTGSGKGTIKDSVELNVPARDGGFTLIATGLDEGFWHLQEEGDKKSINFYVRPGVNTLQTKLTEGHYKLLPGRSYDGYYIEEPNGLPYILK